MFEEESESVLSSDDIDEAIRQSQNHSTIIHTQSVYLPEHMSKVHKGSFLQSGR